MLKDIRKDVLLAMVSISVTKHHDQKQLGGGRVCVSLELQSSASLREIRDGTQTGGSWSQELKQGPLMGAAYWFAYTACSVCFLIVQRTTSPGLAIHTVS